MDIPCRSSWIGAYESFQAGEYDAGASLTPSEPARKWKTAERRPAQIFGKHLETIVKNLK